MALVFLLRSIFSLPFTFGLYHLPPTWVQIEQSQNWCYPCHSNFHFCWIQPGGVRFSEHRGVEGKSDTSANWRVGTYLR